MAQLRAADTKTLDIKTGGLIAALTRVRFFGAGGILEGTHAFAFYELELGVRFEDITARIEDEDLLADKSIKLVTDGDGGLPGLPSDLGLQPTVSIGDLHPYRWISSDSKSIEAVGPYRERSLVRVPAPQRYAIHKLIVASERKGSDRAKSAKDLDQASVLIAALVEQRPFELCSAYSVAKKSGPKRHRALAQSLERIPAIAETLSQLWYCAVLSRFRLTPSLAPEGSGCCAVVRPRSARSRPWSGTSRRR